jgi:hypothetical protein
MVEPSVYTRLVLDIGRDAGSSPAESTIFNAVVVQLVGDASFKNLTVEVRILSTAPKILVLDK